MRKKTQRVTVSKEIQPAPSGVSEPIQGKGAELIETGVIVTQRKLNQYSPKVRRLKIHLFLDSLSQHGNILTACQSAQISIRTVQNWASANDAFRKKYDEAKELGDLNMLKRYENKIDSECLSAPFDKTTGVLAMFRTKKLDPKYRETVQTQIHVAGPAALQFVVHEATPSNPQAEPPTGSGDGLIENA